MKVGMERVRRAGCASSLRLFSRGTAPRETATNTGRWSWNPVRRWCCPDRLQWRLAHTLAEPDGSTPERNRQRSASHEPHWRPPKLSGKSCHGSPCDRACRSLRGGMLQCRANSHGKSVGRRQEQGTDPRKKIREICNCRHNEPRISGTRMQEGDPSVARISFGQHSYPIVRGRPRTVGNAFGKPGKVENSQKSSNRKILEPT